MQSLTAARPKRSPRRLRILCNPVAGRFRRRRLDLFRRALDRLGVEHGLAVSRTAADLVESARGTDPARYDAVVAAGGDGTINLVVNGLAGSSLPLGILPLGTANVLAIEMGLPRRTAALAQLASFGETRPIWPGELFSAESEAGRRFLLMAGAGLDAEVIERLDLTLKRGVGQFAYIVGIIGSLGTRTLGRYALVVDGHPAEAASVVVSRSRFYGGSYLLAPDASLEQRKFQVVLFERGGTPAALRYFWSLAWGRLASRTDVRIVAADTVDIVSPVGAAVQIDGDVVARLPVRLRLAATPLEMICRLP